VQDSGSPSSGARCAWVSGEVPFGTEGGKLEACPPRQEVGRERLGESRGGRVSGSLPPPHAFPRLVAAARRGPCRGAAPRGSPLPSGNFPKVCLAFGLREQSGWVGRASEAPGSRAQGAAWGRATFSVRGPCLQTAAPGPRCQRGDGLGVGKRGLYIVHLYVIYRKCTDVWM